MGRFPELARASTVSEFPPFKYTLKEVREAGAAHRYLEERKNIGKVVLVP